MSDIKEYIKSSIITFIAVFSATILPMLGNDNWHKSILAAAIVTAARAGVKAVLEMLSLIRPTKSI